LDISVCSYLEWGESIFMTVWWQSYCIYFRMETNTGLFILCMVQIVWPFH